MAMSSTGDLSFGGGGERMALPQHAGGVACRNDSGGHDDAYTSPGSDSYFYKGSHDGLTGGGAGVVGAPIAFERGETTISWRSLVHPTSAPAPEADGKGSAAPDRVSICSRPITDVAFAAAGKRTHSQVRHL